MDEGEGETRIHVEIDDRGYLLGPELDLVDVMSRIEAAARSEPTFVQLSDADHPVAVLISAQSKVVIHVRRTPPPPPESFPGDAVYDWEL